MISRFAFRCLLPALSIPLGIAPALAAEPPADSPTQTPTSPETPATSDNLPPDPANPDPAPPVTEGPSRTSDPEPEQQLPAPAPVTAGETSAPTTGAPPVGRSDRLSRSRLSAAPAELDAGVRAAGGGPREATAHLVALHTGVRTLFVLGGGYEPYAQRALLWSFNLGGSVTLVKDGDLSFALGANWEVATSNSDVRDADTSITAHRITVVPEARYSFGDRWVLFGRFGVGGSYLGGTLEDKASDVDREADAGVFTVDPGAGLALQLGPLRETNRGGARFWLVLDAGYLWSNPVDLEFQSEQAPVRSAPIRFEELALHGPYTRLNGSLSF